MFDLGPYTLKNLKEIFGMLNINAYLITNSSPINLVIAYDSSDLFYLFQKLEIFFGAP